MVAFKGFPRETLQFLAGIAEHNEKPWFEFNRALYEAGYVAPARDFVEAFGPSLQKISPGLHYEARIGGSIGRINRDIRFSRDKRLYKDHLDLWFWHGEKKGWTHPGFFMRITADDVWLGAGMHHFEGETLKRYRDAVVDERAGRALVAAIGKIEKAGDYAVGGMERKTIPRGYDKGSSRARYLLWESLPAMAQMKAKDALRPDFGEVALTHFRNTWPVAKWLLEEVVG